MNSIIVIGAIVAVAVLVIAVRWDRKRKQALVEWSENGKTKTRRIEGDKE